MIQQARRDQIHAIAIRALVAHYDVQLIGPLVVHGTCGTCGARVAVDFEDRIDIAIDDTHDDEHTIGERVLGVAESLIDDGDACQAAGHDDAAQAARAACLVEAA